MRSVCEISTRLIQYKTRHDKIFVEENIISKEKVSVKIMRKFKLVRCWGDVGSMFGRYWGDIVSILGDVGAF